MNKDGAQVAMAASPPLRVLLVEDNEFDVAVFARAFRKAEVACEIVRCRRGEEVLEGLRDAELAVDLLVSDHLLPGISGFDLCLELLEKQCLFALVLLTGGGTEQMAIRALRAGIHDYIVKDTAQEYLDLLPLVLPKVARRHRERRARRMALERHSPDGAFRETATPSPAENSSLGLSVCAALVQQRGGRIWVEKGQNQLPNLHFSVPLAPAEADAWRTQQASMEASQLKAGPRPEAKSPSSQPSTPDEPQSRADRRSEHVLIVHSNPIVVFVTTRTLERLGYRTVTVADGDKAVEALEREPFDLVLMGLHLPGQDGLEATRTIRAGAGPDGNAVPILALAIDPDQELESCRQAGMDDHVARPVGFESLNAALARLPTP